MLSRMAKLLVLATVVVALAQGQAKAANSALTTIRVSDMHCEACAAKIRRKLFAVAGVVNVQTRVKTHTAVVMPQRDKQLSPKALWEAVEQAGFEPVKLEGPSGTFTSKPKR